MKLKRLGFRKPKPKPTNESPLLQEHNLPDPTQQQPGWLKAWHEGEQHFKRCVCYGEGWEWGDDDWLKYGIPRTKKMPLSTSIKVAI